MREWTAKVVDVDGNLRLYVHFDAVDEDAAYMIVERHYMCFDGDRIAVLAQGFHLSL